MHAMASSRPGFKTSRPEHFNSCQDEPLSSQTPSSDFVDGGHLDKVNDINKISSYYGNRERSIQSIQSIFQMHSIINTKHTKYKTYNINSIQEKCGSAFFYRVLSCRSLHGGARWDVVYDLQ